MSTYRDQTLTPHAHDAAVDRLYKLEDELFPLARGYLSFVLMAEGPIENWMNWPVVTNSRKERVHLVAKLWALCALEASLENETEAES